MKFEILIVMKTLVTAYKTTQCHNSEDHNPHFQCHGNLKSQRVKLPASYNCVSSHLLLQQMVIQPSSCYVSASHKPGTLTKAVSHKPGTFTKAVSANTYTQFWYRYKSVFMLVTLICLFSDKIWNFQPIALMMEAASTSETSAKFNQNTWHNNPKDSHLQ
jgi:hypothetical protein